ncbi:MAG: peptidylprolyl isomerase [Steroidobacteraceae bacterium]
MNRILATACTLTLAAMLGACAQKTDPKAATGKVDNVAVVDGHNISRNTYNHYVKGVAGKPPEDLTSEQRQELLENLVRAEVIASEAERNGAAAQDETKAVLDLARLQTLQQAAMTTYMKDRKASEEELRAEYDLQVAAMPKTQYRASHILVPTEDAAKALIKQLQGGASFEKLAKASSTDAGSKERGGDLDWFSPDAMTPEFATAVKAMKKGDTTPAPVKTQFGYHVIRVTDTRESAPPPYESVKDRLVQIVEQKKFKAYTDGLVAKAKVTKSL